ncbi:YitT family protein [Ihubacter sp. rT4E-8]|uniref:YitT family protein n=1 Tax=unclassified Ihubacter TaxID=2633299 RepID=UPI00137A3CFE
MKDRGRTVLIDSFFLVLACVVGAFATTAVMIPNGLTSGGLTGVVRILQYFVDINFSLAYYAGAFLILLVVIFTIGFREAKKVLVVTLLYPAILFALELFDFQLLEEKDVILAAIFCGVFSGVCNGIVFWRGYAFCGTESIAKIIKKKLMPQVDISKILLLLDAGIIVISAFIYGRNIALYALVTQFIASKMVDFIMYGFETKIVQVNILTVKPEETVAFVMKDLNRGVSSRTAVGEFTGQSKKELVVLCSPRESMLLKRFLASIDPSAFVTVLHVETVWGSGKGFSSINREE